MTRRYGRSWTWSFILLILIGMQACRKDKIGPRWDVDILAPVFKTSLTIRDLVPDSLLDVDADGQISILHTMELFSLSLDTVLTAPDTSFRYAYALPFPGPVQFPPGSTFNTSDDVTRFDLEDLHLSKLIVRSGQVEVVITNMMNGIIIGNFQLPGATLDGAPFQVMMSLPPGTTTSPSSLSDSRPLDGYVFDLRGPLFDATNTLATHLSYSSSPDGPSITITDLDSLLAVVSYHGIVPEYAMGSFGTRSIEVEPASTEIDLFANVSGTLDLAQVDARVRIKNGIGVDAQAEVHYIRSRNTRTGQVVDLTGPLLQGPLNITRALDLGSTFSPSTKTYQLGQGNSNIEQFLENLPDQIEYSMELTINPLGDISNGHDFLYHDSKVTGELEVDIPLRLIATDLTLVKVVAVDLPGTPEAHAWQKGILHLFVENGFPFSAGLELAVVNEADEVLTVLEPGGTVASGGLGPSGTVEHSTATHLTFEASPGQMQLLNQTGRLRIKAAFNTGDQAQHIQLLERYGMDLQLTLDANWMVNGNE